MMRKTSLIGIFSVSVLLLATLWAQPNMNPGKWEITTKTEMAGMPAQSLTHTQCITASDLVPVGGDASQHCKVTDVKTSGNTVSWKITCGGQGGEMSGTGTITYEGDSMNGTMTMSIPGTEMTIKNVITGKRIGECD